MKFSICWYTVMNTMTAMPTPRPLFAHANSTGAAPPTNVPIMGMNCETMPLNNANGSQYGTFMITRNAPVQAALSTARTVRENRKDEI